MKFNAIEPFIPSGTRFEESKELFVALGFQITWDGGDYIGFERDTCKFILQRYDNKELAENLMIRLSVSNLDEFWQEINAKELDKKFDIKLKEPTQFPYGREVHLLDLAGVCWHIAEGE